MSDLACPACGGRRFEAWRTATSELRPPQRTHYLLERCRSCGTAAVAKGERPEDTDVLYASATYDPRRSRLERLVEVMRLLIELDQRRLTASLSPGARVFEVGAGDGRLLAALAKRGLSAAGIEPAEPYSALARARGLAVETATLEATSLAPGSQDAVVLWHVLEHLEDPRGAFERVRGWLAPGGKLLVAVPNLSSLQATIGGDRWFHQDVPRHLVHFTVEGIVALLTQTGFEVDRVRHVMLEQNFLGMWQTLLNRLTAQRNVFFRFTKRTPSHDNRLDAVRDAVITLVAGPLLVPVAVALELIAGLAGRGGTVVVEATLRRAPEKPVGRDLHAT